LAKAGKLQVDKKREGEEGADLKDNPQEYAGYWPREISGTAAKGLWVSKDLETDARNLFAAGDEVGALMLRGN